MKIKVKTYDELSKDELYRILQLRNEVFVSEQHCIYQDLDYKDQKAIHILGIKDEKVIGYSRVFAAGDYFDLSGIGRLAVNKNERGNGYGKMIMTTSIDTINKRFGETKIQISAQCYLEQFYKDLGFVPYGEVFFEDKLPHIKMIYNN